MVTFFFIKHQNIFRIHTSISIAQNSTHNLEILMKRDFWL
jgi:hypothetical protein